MLSPNFFNTVFVIPILNILLVFYKILLLGKIPGAFGFSIVALTVFVRFLLHPFFKSQIQTAQKMQDIKPHLDKLSHKHKDDKKRLQQEQLKLYQQAGINPASGCLFMIIQIPIFIALYSTLNLFLTNSHFAKTIVEINKVVYFSFLKIQTIDPNFLGFNLAKSPKSVHLWFYYLVPAVTALLQYLQVKFSTPITAPVTDKKDDKKDDKKPEGEDFQKAMNTQMKYVFPVMIGYFSYTLPVGLALYWNIFSIFSIIQYKRIKK